VVRQDGGGWKIEVADDWQRPMWGGSSSRGTGEPCLGDTLSRISTYHVVCGSSSVDKCDFKQFIVAHVTPHLIQTMNSIRLRFYC